MNGLAEGGYCPEGLPSDPDSVPVQLSPGSFSMTVTNTFKPLPPISRGEFEVSGVVTCHFHNPGLLAALQRDDWAYENAMLRLIRPVMPKRRWQRLRGKCKARRARGCEL